MSLLRSLLLLSSSLYLTNARSLSPISLRQLPTKDQTFVDAQGRERIFHGVNAIVKGPPWVPSTFGLHKSHSLVDEDMAILASNGMNSIRLGVMWPGVEPVKGVYNETYLDEIEKIVKSAAKYNIYTLLDMHQDVISEFFCGEGLPLWAVPIVSKPVFNFPGPIAPSFNSTEFDYSTDPNYKLPIRSACNRNSWATYQFSAGTNVAYEALYTDTQLLTAWANMWAHVAARFKNNPNVLGIEIINEPWAGNIFANPLLLIPGLADKLKLQHPYDVVSNAIRAVDSSRLIFFAGCTWDDFGSFFDHAPGGSQYGNTSVFAFHYYEPPQLTNTTKFDFSLHTKDAQRFGTGRFLTEFGAPGYNSQFSDNTAIADDNKLSWMIWEWKEFCEENEETQNSNSQNGVYGACKTGYGGIDWSSGSPNSTQTYKLSRAYPVAVGGDIVNYSFDINFLVFKLVYTINPSITAPTLIYVSSQHYLSNDDLDLSVVPSTSAYGSYDHASNLVSIYPVAGSQPGVTVTVTIEKKNK